MLKLFKPNIYGIPLHFPGDGKKESILLHLRFSLLLSFRKGELFINEQISIHDFVCYIWLHWFAFIAVQGNTSYCFCFYSQQTSSKFSSNDIWTIFRNGTNNRNGFERNSLSCMGKRFRSWVKLNFMVNCHFNYIIYVALKRQQYMRAESIPQWNAIKCQTYFCRKECTKRNRNRKKGKTNNETYIGVWKMLNLNDFNRNNSCSTKYN